MTRAMRLAVALTAVFGLGACVANTSSTASRGGTFPPVRTLWQSASAETQAEHARSLLLALETPAHNQGRAWSTGEASGTVTVTRTIMPADELLCREFVDTITTAAGSARAEDAACWLGDGWHYVRPGSGSALVTSPALAQADRVYTVESGGTLADVASATGSDLAMLEQLNPVLPEQLEAGTVLLLP